MDLVKLIRDLDNYQFEASKTMNTNLTETEINTSMTMKLTAEIGLFSDKVVNADHFQGKLDRRFVKENLGDMLWYLAILAYNNGINLSEIATANVDKLRKRHGTEYNENYYLYKELK